MPSPHLPIHHLYDCFVIWSVSASAPPPGRVPVAQRRDVTLGWPACCFPLLCLYLGEHMRCHLCPEAEKKPPCDPPPLPPVSRKSAKLQSATESLLGGGRFPGPKSHLVRVHPGHGEVWGGQLGLPPPTPLPHLAPCYRLPEIQKWAAISDPPRTIGLCVFARQAGCISWTWD